jgi:amino acid adenylation domain-containing protein
MVLMAATEELNEPHVVRTSYKLGPMQEAMLYHSWRAPQSGFEVSQLVGELHEELDVIGFKSAWRQVMQRHAVLRTRIPSDGPAVGRQEVQDEVDLPWAQQDWTQLSEADREEAFAGFLRVDRARGFPFDRPPLWRLTLFQIGKAHARFVWTFHHALLDGRSLPIVLREVFYFMDQFVRREPADLPLPRPYRDYIHWLEEQDFSAAETFWRERLKGFTRPTPLMFATRHDGETGSRHGEMEWRLPASLTTRLQSFAEKNGFTLGTVVQGAWALLSSRATGEREVLFGATRACRRSAPEGADSMVGVFINTLPLRVTVDPELEWLPWLQRLRCQWNELRPHEHTPLVKLRSWSELPSEGPLFDTIVVFETDTLEQQMRRGGKGWLRREFRLHEQPGSPLVLAAYGGAQLTLKLFYDRHRITDGMAEQILGHLRTLLASVAANPRRRLSELPLLTATAQRALVAQSNQPHLEFPPSLCLHRAFETQARRTPDAVALVSSTGRLTYAELNERANVVAHALRQRKVGPETCVALYLDRSPDLIVGMLGILKAGGAYVPMDDKWPAERLLSLLGDCRAPVVLSETKLAPILAGATAEVLCIDELKSAASATSPNNSEAEAEAEPAPENLAYVIYTSGSTGQPKGVMVTHHNVMRLFQATRRWFHFARDDVWTLFHSPAFDFSTWEIWGALLHGGTLVIPAHWVTRSPEDFWKLLIAERVTVLNQTPSAFRQLLQFQETWTGDSTESARPFSLRWIIFGGEALEPASLKPWFDRYGDQQPQLVNMYGITETTVHTTYRLLRKQDVTGGSVIGVPIPDLQLYVLDERGEPAPIGVPGEIYIGGAGLARGYLNQPQLTAKRFIHSRFRQGPKARLYRTGDRARLLPDRDVEYLGRMDQQVKVRGFRIEPGEIEAVLGQLPSIRQAVVALQEIQPGDRRLVAYLVTDQPAPTLDEIRNLLKNRLPEYMVPAAIVFLNALPLTTNGKIDRASLPPPGPQALAKAPVFAAPRPGLERLIAGIWQELLGVETIGVHDHFFEMGGHSLLLVQMHARLQAALRRTVPITELFQCPTISTLSRRLGAESASSMNDVDQRLRRMKALQNSSS